MYKELTCPFEPYAVYSKFPFSSFPPHLRIAEARKVDFRALCAGIERSKLGQELPNTKCKQKHSSSFTDITFRNRS